MNINRTWIAKHSWNAKGSWIAGRVATTKNTLSDKLYSFDKDSWIARNIWVAGIIIPILLIAGWNFFRVDMNEMRANYAISPNAVIMFTKSDCGSVCEQRATQISAAGIEVVPLDINDGTAGTHLWRALGGGEGPFPAFLVAGADNLHNTAKFHQPKSLKIAKQN